MKNVRRRVWAAFVVAGLIVFIGLLVRQYASLEWVIDRENQLRSIVAAKPVRAWLIGFAVYSGLCLVPGTSGKSVVCGWFFGFWPAVLLADVALTIAGFAIFLASRSILRPVVEAKYPVLLATLKERLQGQTAYYLLMLRFLHTPFSFVNYTAGATSIVPARTFFWTTMVGMLPGTMIFVFVGTRLPTLAQLAEKGPLSLLDPPLVISLAATAVLPIMIKWLGDRIVRRSRPSSDVVEAIDSEGMP